MQDRAIAHIGHFSLSKKSDFEPVDLYIQNMFPGKEYQMLLLVFEVQTVPSLSCFYKGLDVEKVGQGLHYLKYAYRKGSSRGGDVTFTTKLSIPADKKIKTLKEQQFKKIRGREDEAFFSLVEKCFCDSEVKIKADIEEAFTYFDKKMQNSTGLSIKIIKEGRSYYLRDYASIKELILESGSERKAMHNGTISRTKNEICSVSGKRENEIYGFAAPYKYSTPDKSGFISGFFNKEKFWRNYPISSNEALALEEGRNFIFQNLSGYFYGYEYLYVPHTIISTDQQKLEKIIKLLKTALDEEKESKGSKEKRKRAEDRVLKIVGKEDNYCYLDLLFYKRDMKTDAITIHTMLEEVLPSRFRTLFIDIPELVNKRKLFQEALVIKKEAKNLTFSFQLVKSFFPESFLDVVQKLFHGKPMSYIYVFESFIKIIRKNYNAGKTGSGYSESGIWTVKKGIMLLYYLQELGIINYNKLYQYMEPETIEKKEGRFNTQAFHSFVKENASFLDSDIKVGIFAVGVLVRFLFDIQQASLQNTPFENKLRGYKINADLLTSIYTEALDKIQKYQKNFYVYQDLRNVINQFFIIKKQELNTLNNNELSFYFVAGLEMGRQFKNEPKEK